MSRLAPFESTSRALIIPRELFRKSFLADSRPIKSRSHRNYQPLCHENGMEEEEGVSEGVQRDTGRVARAEGEFACAELSVLWRLATGWRRFPRAQEVASTPAKGQGRIGQSWKERGRSFWNSTAATTAIFSRPSQLSLVDQQLSFVRPIVISPARPCCATTAGALMQMHSCTTVVRCKCRRQDVAVAVTIGETWASAV